MCFSSKKSSSTPTPTQTPADPSATPAANPTDQRQRVISSTTAPAPDPLGQGQLGG